ncbi:PREDICTED: serine/threonine-protein kinase Nek3 isoform X5 [Gavialis gangeticus]|uniref:serine/threonine-protein kinase Nek3 isoform X5 n=1 Tax=Gavialis gangeticus TaxID=94835 RepID=UPI00092F54B7|nr:PREDICTED: serine/threonine-protein kinase Nek3 isoform X5 [Gavialis gangeticus]
MEEYTVLKVLGEGSFGRALLVCDKTSSQKYAMKEIRLPKSPSDVENSRKEAILLAKMKHANIVGYKESFEADGHLYIVMEYCDDGDLMQKIKRQRGKLFPEDTILCWFVQLCLGVKYIHDKRILHRDIKSKNIFLTQNGKVKLGDFGSARLLKNATAYACTYVGTPYYVPPEIWENMPYNNKSDIWSLGCVLYELCTLKHPMFKRNPKNRPSASTILARGCLAKFIETCLPAEIESAFNFQVTAGIQQILKEPKRHRRDRGDTKAGARSSGGANSTRQNEDQWSHSDLKNTTKILSGRTLKERGSSKEEKYEALTSNTDLPCLQRRQWERGAPSAVVNVLGSASLLSSSFTAEEEKSGCVIKYSENNPRKQWIKETPQTLMNILESADISLAFKTYTIYKAASGDLLKGPLSDESKASDEIDGDLEAIITDSERLEPRSDEEDTDFEEEEEPDWVAELKKMAKIQ